jgi:hypothetical protein
MVSRTDEIIETLRKEGKVKTVKVEHTKKMDDEMRKVQVEYKRKAASSWSKAKDVILD